jgi:hypothetical protein
MASPTNERDAQEPIARGSEAISGDYARSDRKAKLSIASALDEQFGSTKAQISSPIADGAMMKAAPCPPVAFSCVSAICNPAQGVPKASDH